MKIGITKLLPENIAPSTVKNIAIFDGDKKIGTVDVSKMRLPNVGAKLYSFGLLSDVHLADYRQVSYTKFDNALTYFKSHGAAFCCHSGDITDYGFWYPTATYQQSTYNPILWNEYANICGRHTIPVYGCCGNHENYNGYDITGTYADSYGADPTLVINNLEKLQEYTGNGLYFKVEHENDVFLFVGQPHDVTPMSADGLQWLYEALEDNRNKRCFVFVHPHIVSGNPSGAYKSNPLFENWDETPVFKTMLRHYKNTILFHGHTHAKFETQTEDIKAIYSAEEGFRSVHVPSCGAPRDVVGGELENRWDESQGYLVDVYENCIVLNGIDLVGMKQVPIGQYRIDTRIVRIPEKSFVDDTRTIVT